MNQNKQGRADDMETWSERLLKKILEEGKPAASQTTSVSKDGGKAYDQS
jgi:hypothetical protein